MEKLLTQPPVAGAAKIELGIIEQAMRAVLMKPKPDALASLTELHTPPASFQRGQPLTIMASAPHTAISGLHLRYRHVNQSETWQMVEMEKGGAECRAVIPAEYTNSPYPLQYYFQVRTGNGQARLCPGLEPGWQGQPYYVVRQG